MTAELVEVESDPGLHQTSTDINLAIETTTAMTSTASEKMPIDVGVVRLPFKQASTATYLVTSQLP